jgi:hypothetical protein
MMGFLTSVVEEFLTGRGTLQQIGFQTPDQSLLGAILLIFGGATLVGTVSTLTKATGGKLSLKCEPCPSAVHSPVLTEQDAMCTGSNAHSALVASRLQEQDETDHGTIDDRCRHACVSSWPEAVPQACNAI